MVVFPSELALPVAPAWESADLDGVLTLQYDDGTTVTNVLTGATGETFDVANIVGIAAAAGERVSATWVTKPSGIDGNPFSLLQTQQQQQDEYGLKIATASQQLSILFVGAYSGTKYLTDGTSEAISGSGTYVTDGTTEQFISRVVVTDSNEFHYFDFNKQSGNTVTSETSDLVATLVNFPVDDSQWQRVITRNIFTIGGGGYDYTTLKTFFDADKAVPEFSERVGYLYGSITEPSQIHVRGYSGYSSKGDYHVIGAQQATKFGDANNSKINSTTDFIKRSYDDATKGCKVLFEQIELETTGEIASVSKPDQYIFFKKSAIKSTKNGVSLSVSELGALVDFDDCLIDVTANTDGYAFYPIINGEVALTNTLLVGNTSSGAGIIRANGGIVTLQNVIGLNKGTGICFGHINTYTYQGSNVYQNAPYNSRLDGVSNVVSDQPIASWLNAENQITPAGRTAIGTDTGWNGSTIAAWADKSSTSTDLVITPDELSSTLSSLNPNISTTSNVLVNPAVGSLYSESISPFIALFSEITLNVTQTESTITTLNPMLSLVAPVYVFSLTTSYEGTALDSSVLPNSEIIVTPSTVEQQQEVSTPVVTLNSQIIITPLTIGFESNTQNPIVTLSIPVTVQAQVTQVDTESLDSSLTFMSEVLIQATDTEIHANAINPVVLLSVPISIIPLDCRQEQISVEPVVVSLSSIVSVSPAVAENEQEGTNPHVALHFGLTLLPNVIHSTVGSLNPNVSLGINVKIESFTIKYVSDQVLVTYTDNQVQTKYSLS